MILRQIMQDVNDLKCQNNSKPETSNQNGIINNNKKQTLTRSELSDIRQSIFIRYEKKSKIENTIAMFKSHLENNTVPPALSFVKFPAPLWKDDAIFVDEHNEIIHQAQIHMVQAIIDRGNALINCLNNELNALRIDLDQSYDGNKDKFFDNIKASVNNNLKPFLEASNAKLMRLQNNYFEDKFNTVYELQENTSDDYINNYLDIQYQNTDASNKHTDNSKDSSNKNNALTNNASSYIKKHKGNYKRKFEDNDTSHKSNLHNNGHNTHYNNNLRPSYYNSKNNQTGNYFPLKRQNNYLNQHNNNPNQQNNNHINASNQITSKQQQNFQLVRNQNSKT